MTSASPTPTRATTQYLQIINILKRENLLDVVGEQGHAFSTTGNMAVHKANLDRLAATGIPLQITELDIDGVSVRRRARRRGAAARLPPHRPGLLGAPGASRASRSGAGASPTTGATRRTRRSCSPTTRPSPRRCGSTTTCAGSRRRSRPAQTPRARRRQRAGRQRVQADDWASTDRPPEPAHVHVADHRRQRRRPVRHRAGHRASCASPSRELLDELTTYTLKVRVSDGFHESAETDVAVVTGDLANVADGAAGGTVPATLSLTLGARRVVRRVHARRRAGLRPRRRTATVTSDGGRRRAERGRPVASTGRLVNGAFTLASRSGAVTGASRRSSTPLTLHSYAARRATTRSRSAFKQAHRRARSRCAPAPTAGPLTFTLSTTTP